jgi:hypothetical protein
MPRGPNTGPDPRHLPPTEADPAGCVTLPPYDNHTSHPRTSSRRTYLFALATSHSTVIAARHRGNHAQPTGKLPPQPPQPVRVRRPVVVPARPAATRTSAPRPPGLAERRAPPRAAERHGALPTHLADTDAQGTLRPQPRRGHELGRRAAPLPPFPGQHDQGEGAGHEPQSRAVETAAESQQLEPQPSELAGADEGKGALGGSEARRVQRIHRHRVN